MLLDIVELGDPVLRRKAHKVSQIDKDLRLLVNDMVETLHDAGGVGLAAPQIGESIRLIVVEWYEHDEDADSESEEEKPKQIYKVINPEIIWHSEEKVMGTEGCLSIPGYSGDVERWESIKVKGLNPFGRPVKISATGWLARIFQHEIDHLEGICYIDKAETIYQPGEETDPAEETDSEPAE